VRGRVRAGQGDVAGTAQTGFFGDVSARGEFIDRAANPLRGFAMNVPLYLGAADRLVLVGEVVGNTLHQGGWLPDDAAVVAGCGRRVRIGGAVVVCHLAAVGVAGEVELAGDRPRQVAGAILLHGHLDGAVSAAAKRRDRLEAEVDVNAADLPFGADREHAAV